MSSTNLISLQRDYFLSMLSSVKTSNGLKNLIIDEVTERLLSYLFEPQELLRQITAIERIDKMRKPQLSIEGVYFLEPNNFSLKCLMADFTIQPHRYKKLHLIFLPGFNKESEEMIMSNHALQYNTASLQTFYFTMLPLEQSMFVTQNVDSMKIYYNENSFDLINSQVEKTVDALINLCIITGEYPMVRYYSPLAPLNDSALLPKMIASQFQLRIDDYARTNSNFPPIDNPRPRSIFVITDRTMDLYAPILHEFTYQAMTFDLLEFDKNKDGQYLNEYSYEAENERGEKELKNSRLNDKDPDWVSLRHLHILDASETLVNFINDLIAKNPLMVDRSNASSSTDLLYIVAHLKDFDEERRLITVHKKLTDELMKINAERGLAAASEFEQDCASNGISFEGERIKGMADDLLDLLALSRYKEGDKVRLIIIYAIYRGGIIKQDLIKLIKFADLMDLQPVILALFQSFENLGFLLLKPNLKQKRFKKQTFHQIDNDGQFNTSRFRPGAKGVIESSISYTLDENVFPYVKDKPLNQEDEDGLLSNDPTGSSLKNPRHKATWAKNRSSNLYVPPRQRFFYFVAGGVTYSEVRTAYELSNALNKDVIIGGDEILTPRDFINAAVELNAERKVMNLFADRKKVLDERKVPEDLLKVQVTSTGKMSKILQSTKQVASKAPVPQPVAEQKAPPLSDDKKKDKEKKDKKEKKRHKFTKFLK